MEGLFQIVIVLVFVVVSILDGISRKKRQEEQKDRMRRNESAEEGVLLEDPLEELGELGYDDAGLDRPVPASRGAESDPQARETADQLVPADLWAILTGQKPMPEAPAPPPSERSQLPPVRPEAEPVSADRETEGPWWSWGKGGEGEGGEKGIEVPPPVIVPEAPLPSRAGRTSPPGGTRRSARWMEGLDREPGDVRVGSRPVPDGLDAAAVWDAYQDISTGEIGSAEEEGLRYDETVGETAGREGAAGRRTTASRYAALLTSGNQEDLRSAIVLREVLGPPIGQRARGWD
jgi:hypothetical protein